jgi:hypothetical protein
VINNWNAVRTKLSDSFTIEKSRKIISINENAVEMEDEVQQFKGLICS